MTDNLLSNTGYGKYDYYEESGNLYCSTFNKGGNLTFDNYLEGESLFDVTDIEDNSISGNATFVYSDSSDNKTNVSSSFTFIKQDDNWLLDSYTESE